MRPRKTVLSLWPRTAYVFDRRRFASSSRYTLRSAADTHDSGRGIYRGAVISTKNTMCIWKKERRNPRYINEKLTPLVAKTIPYGCGKCIECRKQRADGWRVRLIEELKANKTHAEFVTLTFNDESLVELRSSVKNIENLKEWEADTEICRIALERWRKRVCKAKIKAIRHVFVQEWGDDVGRIHMHGIVWTELSNEEFERLWKYGFVDYGYGVDLKAINYIIKYIFKGHEKYKDAVTKVFCSKGIGRDFIESSEAERLRKQGPGKGRCYKDDRGFKHALPRYYAEKLWTEEDRARFSKSREESPTYWLNGIERTPGNRYFDSWLSATKNNLRKKYIEKFGKPG